MAAQMVSLFRDRGGLAYNASNYGQPRDLIRGAPRQAQTAAFLRSCGHWGIAQHLAQEQSISSAPGARGSRLRSADVRLGSHGIAGRGHQRGGFRPGGARSAARRKTPTTSKTEMTYRGYQVTDEGLSTWRARAAACASLRPAGHLRPLARRPESRRGRTASNTSGADATRCLWAHPAAGRRKGARGVLELNQIPVGKGGTGRITEGLAYSRNVLTFASAHLGVRIAPTTSQR